MKPNTKKRPGILRRALVFALFLPACSVAYNRYVDGCYKLIAGSIEFDADRLSFHAQGARLEMVGPSPPCLAVTKLEVENGVDWHDIDPADDATSLVDQLVGTQVDMANPALPATTGQMTGAIDSADGRTGTFYSTITVWNTPLDSSGNPTGGPIISSFVSVPVRG